MTNFYFNLNQIQSNSDGESMVKRQSRLTSNPGEMNKKEQLSRDCLRDASEMPLRCLRYLSRIAMIFCVLAMSVGQMWGATATYVPLGLKTISTDEVVYCTAITAAGDPTTSWVVVPNHGTSSKGYTQITSTTDNGNPQGITDNLASTKSNVAMIQIKKDGNTYSSSKRVIHMHVKGITGVIAHGNTSSNYGLSIAVAEFNNNLSTFPSDITSGVRKSNSGSILIKKDGLDASKEYIVSIYSSGGDIYFYAVEFIAGGGGSTTYSVTYDGNGKTSGSVPTDSNSPYEAGDEVTVLGNTGSLAKTNYTFTGWNTATDGSGTHYDAGATFSMGTANVTLYAQWELNLSTHEPGKYETAAGSGGYGKTLKTVNGRDFEVYMFNNSTLRAGSTATISDGLSMLTASNGNDVIDGKEGWICVKSTGDAAGSGATQKAEFSVTSGTSNDQKTHYIPISNAGYIKLKVSGYDQFSMVGRDGSTTAGSGKFVVKIDGVAQSLTSTTTDHSVYRFSMTTGTHTIEVTSDGSTACRFRGFSLRLPAAACTAPSSVAISGTSSYLPGQNISLTAAATGGSGTPTTYQWYHRGVAIDGATSATYTKSNCTIDDAGNYTCKVTMGGSCSTTSPNFAVRVYSVKVWSNGGGSVIGNYPLTYQSSNNGRAVISTLSASTTYEFKVIDNVGGTSDSTIYYGNGGTIHHNTAIDPATWDFGSTTATNCKLVTGVETGDFTFNVDITHNGSGSGFYVTVNVAYPTKTIYLTPGVWNADGAKFAIYYYDANGGTGWTDFMTPDDCGMSAEIPVWDGVKMIAARINGALEAPAFGDGKSWNQTSDLTVSSSYNSIVVSDWSNITYNSNFSTPTYTISYNKGTNGTGSKASESKTCGVAFTLPGSTFTYGGHTQDGWATSDNGAVAYALSGSYTTNDDEEFFPHWKCNTPTITDNGDNTVTITVPSGTTVRYTTDGSTPTSSTGTVYSSAFTIDATVTVKAIAYQSGCTDSEVASQACTYHAAVGDEHVYYYKDATHYVSSSYKNPEGGTPSGSDNVALTTPWTIRNSTFMTGLTSVVATAARYDNKTNHMNAYIKLRQTDGGKIVFTIASGYTATIKIKMGGYSGANTNITMKLNDSGDNITYSGTMSGAGTTEDNYAQLTYADLAAGAYTLKPTSGSLYISQIDIETEAVAACTAAPTVTAGSNSSITSTTATVSCASGISSLGTGGCTITSYGFVLGTSANPTLSNTAHEVGTTYTTTGTSFSKNLTGLTASTTYYVRPYATNGYGTAYGTQTSFTTSAAAASQTALVINTLYEVPDMIPSGATLTDDDQFFEGLSANTKFQLIGSASGSTTPKANSKSTNDKTIDGITFDDGSMWFKGTASLTSNIPTTYGLSFIVPSAGKLYLYFSGTSTNIKLAKSGETGSKPSCPNGYGAVDVTAGTYYLYGTGTSAPYCFYGLKLCSTYSVSITTNNTTKTSGETGSTAAVNGKAYTATFTANTGYTLPSDVTVSIGGVAQTKGAGYTWTVSSGTGTLTVPAAQVTGNIVVTVTGTAAATYSLTYNCNGAESGCPSNTTASALPNPLPSAPTKDGYTFGGWFTDEDLTDAAVAGATMTGATTLYAKWTVNSSSECITITNFATSNVNNTCGDGNGKIFYGYKGTVSDANALTITSNDGNDRGQNSGAEMRLTYNKLMRIYANNTTNAAPATFSNVTSVSFKWKFIASGNSGNTELTSSYTVKVGSTTIANAVSITGKTKDGYQTVTIDNLAQLSGYVEIKFGGSSSSYNVYLDDIEICTASMASCTTPVLPTLSNQSLCEGADIAAWNATPTNASTITGKGESISYSWKKKGNATELANTASFDLGASAAESQAGTYVVTVTVSKTGYASATATKEVTLTVNEATEVTAITADKATVYPTNSVTLTATANMDATWQWYTCANAEGADESSIGGATSASYTITAPASAGTYYYKVKATGSCGIGSMVYTLTVSAAAGGDCFHYVSVLPDKDISPSSGASIVTPTYATTLEGGTMKVGSQQITITKNGLKLESSKSVSITLDAALEAGNVVIVKGTSATAGYGVTINGVNFYEADSKTFDVSYTVVAGDGLVGKTALTVMKYSGSSYLQEIKITGCGASCTDPEVTASVNNSTACVGSSVTFTATGAHASANYQWQKYSGGAWTNIASATAATYNIASVVAGDAGKYRVIATHDCSRTSNEVTLNVPVAPVFGSFTATRSVMATQALSITDVEASDATSYAWYKSADATYDAGTDTKVGTTQELLLASGGEAAGATYYLFCVASNACGSTTSSAITVNVTALVEEDCATRGTEGAAEFGFQNSGCGQGTYNSASCWTMNSNSKILIYSAPDGKYFKTMKVTIASSSASKASYNWSIDGGTSYTANGVAITGVTTTLTEKTIDLSANGNVNEVKIGRNFGNGESSGTLYVSKICFEYTSACAATTVTPSVPSKTHTIGESFTAPTFTLGPAAVSSGTLTYSSSDEEIASVDESGNVTFNGTAGTVTITAAYAGGTVSTTDYCASEGSYTITVSCEGGAPKIVAASSVNMSGCNSSVTLNAKKQDGTTDFTGGSYQWFHNGEEIEDATAKSYTATQTGVYTVAYTSAGGCTSPSTNNATVTSTTVEPEVTKLVPFHYYHVDKTYTAQMKDRHLFSVKGSAAYGSTGKNFKLTMSRNDGEEEDITTTASIFVTKSDDGQVDTVMIDLNKLSGKYSEGDELVLTCAAVDCSGNVSAVYKDEITINVIGATPTLALICSGSDIAAGTRDTKKLTVGGDFLTGYNKADLCQQTGNTSFDANTEWGLYTRLKENYIVTPVNGYANFNKLNYEPFDILLLTDYPKASKSDAAKTVLDDMADLCDYRPMLSFKAHMVSKTPSKWAAKGFTTSPVVPKNTRTRLNIVCYAHPMFSTLKSTATHIQKDNDDPSQIVYTMLTGAGYESSKGLQGFELEAAENFVTIGLVHYNATPADGTPSAGLVTWTPGTEDRMLVTAVERQENLEARMIMFAVNCGAQSKFTETGRNVVLKCLEYLLDDDPLHVADCSFTFDNGAGNSMNAAEQAEACASCTGTKGDGKWSTAANWGPDYVVRPGKDTEVKIAAPVTVDPAVGTGAATNFTPIVRSVRILEGGQVKIPAGSYLEVVSTIRRMDDNDIYPTEVEDLHIGSSETGNGTLIFNNSSGDTKAHVGMYSKGFIDYTSNPKGDKNYQYMGVPCVDINAAYNYYGSWIYSWSDKGGSYGWKKVANGGIVTTWTGYCITQESAGTYYDISGTLAATGTKDIDVPANENMVVGNSWTAPIYIKEFTDDDFENLLGNVYFFNTGIDKDYTSGHEQDLGDRYASSTYVTVPIHSSPYTGDSLISSMQGFFVKSNGSAGALHLDYDRHVRPSTNRNILSGVMHAPRRANAQSDEPAVLKIKVSGENYDDKLLLLAREDFSMGFDNGWDGDKWDGNESALYIYTKDEAGTENSVSAIPEMEGTVIGFRAGEDDAYTLHFEYLNSAEELYLFDTETNAYTKIMTGATYRFFTDDKEKHDRFIITRKSPQVATDVDDVDSGKRREVRKLLIEDKMYILVNGMLYDATGKVVK